MANFLPNLGEYNNDMNANPAGEDGGKEVVRLRLILYKRIIK
jgi:hypothetical protein